MKAVNLIPSDARRGRSGMPGDLHAPTYTFLGLLAAALLLVTVYVLTTNSISDRKAKLASLRVQVAQQQSLSGRLTNYLQFAQMAQQRTQTVRQLAATRFDWHGALSDLSKVVPANTSLQSLVASASLGTSATGSSGAPAGASTGSSFQLTGCTSSQDDVARLLSRLRLINGVTKVSLSQSAKSSSTQPGAPVSASVAPVASSGSSSSPASAQQGCGPNTPTFNLTVFFGQTTGAVGVTSGGAK